MDYKLLEADSAFRKISVYTYPNLICSSKLLLLASALFHRKIISGLSFLLEHWKTPSNKHSNRTAEFSLLFLLKRHRYVSADDFQKNLRYILGCGFKIYWRGTGSYTLGQSHLLGSLSLPF